MKRYIVSMDFEKIVGMWSEDCHIDSTELAREDLNTPVVHNKYLKIFSVERIALFKLKAKVKQTKRMLMEYYSGDLNDPETLDDINRDPWLKKVLKGDLDTYIDSDSEMIAILLQLALQEEKVDYLEAVIKSINNRGWQIRNAIEWNKFTK